MAKKYGDTFSSLFILLIIFIFQRSHGTVTCPYNLDGCDPTKECNECVYYYCGGGGELGPRKGCGEDFVAECGGSKRIPYFFKFLKKKRIRGQPLCYWDGNISFVTGCETETNADNMERCLDELDKEFTEYIRRRKGPRPTLKKPVWYNERPSSAASHLNNKNLLILAGIFLIVFAWIF